MQELPIIRLLPGRHRRLAQGYPWVFSNELDMTPEAKALEPGSLVRLVNAGGEPEGIAFFNRHTLIAARLLTRSVKVAVDEDFLAGRLGAALTLRQRLYNRPFYRLVHAEADGLPGTVIDRYGDVLVVQINTAGMERLKDALVAALERVLSPTTILLKDDSPARAQEGLPPGERLAKGEAPGVIAVEENGATYFADLSQGQKTGWFFDQRENRAWIARFAGGLAGGGRVLDGYSYSGGFTIQAALAGAAEVLALDRSEAALALAKRAAEVNGVAERCRFEKAEVFQRLAQMKGEGRAFELVLVDPPAFVKTRKDLVQGLKGYRKLARLAAQLVSPGGVLFIASCSHHADPANFAQAVAGGLSDAGRSGRILQMSGAAPDHPVHPQLPETAYLKAMTIALD